MVQVVRQKRNVNSRKTETFQSEQSYLVEYDQVRCFVLFLLPLFFFFPFFSRLGKFSSLLSRCCIFYSLRCFVGHKGIILPEMWSERIRKNRFWKTSVSTLFMNILLHPLWAFKSLSLWILLLPPLCVASAGWERAAQRSTANTLSSRAGTAFPFVLGLSLNIPYTGIAEYLAGHWIMQRAGYLQTGSSAYKG